MDKKSPGTMDHLPQGSSFWSYEGCNPAGFLSHQVDNWHTCLIAALLRNKLRNPAPHLWTTLFHQGCPDPISVCRNPAGFRSGHPCSPENFKALPKSSLTTLPEFLNENQNHTQRHTKKKQENLNFKLM